MVQNSSNQLMMKFQLSRGILGRGNRLGKPSGVEKLFVCSNVVAKEPNLLPLSHPFQHYFHVILACQIFQSNFLDTFPGVSNSDGTMLLNYIEEGSCDCLPLLRRRFQDHGSHLRLRFLRQTSNRRPKHSTLRNRIELPPTNNEESKL